jgi:hypothetical protein
MGTTSQNNTTVENCLNLGKITGAESNEIQCAVGGITAVGGSFSWMPYASVCKCVNVGSVTGYPDSGNNHMQGLLVALAYGEDSVSSCYVVADSSLSIDVKQLGTLATDDDEYDFTSGMGTIVTTPTSLASDFSNLSGSDWELQQGSTYPTLIYKEQ